MKLILLIAFTITSATAFAAGAPDAPKGRIECSVYKIRPEGGAPELIARATGPLGSTSVAAVSIVDAGATVSSVYGSSGAEDETKAHYFNLFLMGAGGKMLGNHTVYFDKVAPDSHFVLLDSYLPHGPDAVSYNYDCTLSFP